MENKKCTSNCSSNIIVQSTDYSIRTENMDGKDFLVVPVVMMVEGVHAGSGGPILHLAEELGSIPESWNGIPVTISHPQEQQDGVDVFVSANSPQQFPRSVGRIFNTKMEDGKLKAEAWLDLQKLETFSASTLAYIRMGRPIDVSVGIFTDNEEEEGEWNGEQYVAIAHNYRPDHLALLPDEVGACSWSDGCGIRVNSKNKGYEMKKDFEVFKQLNQDGLAVVPVVNGIDTNSANLSSITSAIYNMVNSMDNDLRVYYVEEIYQDYYIYRMRNRGTGETKMYKQVYSLEGDADNVSVKVEADPIEVQRNVTYDALSTKRRTIFNNNKNEKEMAKEEIVSRLIAHGATGKTRFTECDRQWLSTLSEDALLKLEPKEEVQTTKALDVNTAIEFLKNNKPKSEEVLALLPESEVAAYKQGLAIFEAQKKELVETITSNSEMKEEDLANLPFETLQKLAKTVQPADYSGQGAGAIETNSAEKADDFMPIMGWAEPNKQ